MCRRDFSSWVQFSSLSAHEGPRTYSRFILPSVSVRSTRFLIPLKYNHLHLYWWFGIRISTSLTVWTEVKLRSIFSSQSSVLFAASLRVMILYTLSLKLLSEVSRRAVSRSSSMLRSSAPVTAKDLECFTVTKQRKEHNQYSWSYLVPC